MHWLTLTLAILCEVFATTMLKLSDGFTRPLPLLGMTSATPSPSTPSR